MNVECSVNKLFLSYNNKKGASPTRQEQLIKGLIEDIRPHGMNLSSLAYCVDAFMKVAVSILCSILLL